MAREELSVLASDAYQGRETGMPGADKAAQYIAAEFKKIGLQPPVNGGYYFNVPLIEKRTKIRLLCDGRDFNFGTDVYDYGNAPNGTVDFNEVLFVGYGTAAEIQGADLASKVLLWIDEDKAQGGKPADKGSAPTPARNKIIDSLVVKNPAFIIAINPDIGVILNKYGSEIKLPTISLKNENKSGNQLGIFFLSTRAADGLLAPSGKLSDSLISTAARGGAMPQVLKAEGKIMVENEIRDLKAADILGYLPGTDSRLKDETLIISAHYDHLGVSPNATTGDRIFNGADDDASGTTAIIDIARAFAEAQKKGRGPRRSILFIAMVGEEEGLLGSKFYTDHPLFSLDSTIADLNMDMMGRIGYDYAGKSDSANYLYVLGSALSSNDLYNITETANRQYTNLILDKKYDDPKDSNHFFRRFDSFNFAMHGIPVLAYINGLHPDYHQPGDEVSKINFPLLAKRAQLVFYTAWALANTEKRPFANKN